MATRTWEIDPDITRARTLPGWVYGDPEIYHRSVERVFAPSWQLVGNTDALAAPGSVVPTQVLAGCLDEPILLTRDGEQLRCLSNVCTHRGNLVCETAGVEKSLRCRYHGRRFGLDGRFASMPEFEGVANFPGREDDLPAVQHDRWKKLIFASLAPAHGLQELVAEMDRRVGWLPFERAVLNRERSRDYPVAANWALYCDNFLEGFHIPYVHPALNRVIDYGDYRTELFARSNVQIGMTSRKEDAFELPASSPDHGSLVAGYYFWLFPNTMLNFYPWGVSINQVRPQGPDRSVVSYFTWVWDEARFGSGAGSGLEQVEHEDEEVVESVQRGVRSRLYDRGRYSPSREAGVHQFHRLWTEALRS